MISVNTLLNRRFKGVELSEPFKRAIGKPELCGSWIIWGSSFNGKTSFALQLAKELSQFAKVAYNTLEEGISLSFQAAARRNQLAGCKNIVILDKYDLNAVEKLLQGKRKPKIIITDSLQHAEISYEQYKELLKNHPKNLFIWLSHADGASPSGRTASAIRYDAAVKIRVESYTAHCLSRYGGGEPYTVWEQGAKNIM